MVDAGPSELQVRAQRARAIAGESPIVAIALAALTFALQIRLHAYSADFGQDEASHYISSLAIHDYLRSNIGSSPLAFLKSFHAHYPLVGIGHWGPFYYGVAAVWMLVFSTTLASVMALSATVTTVTAFFILSLSRKVSGRWPALCAAFAFILAPLVERGSGRLMLDIPITLMCLAALYAYARYLREGLLRHSIAFALVASAAMLIKGNAGCLAFVPPLSILFARRWDLLRRPSFWAPLLIVALLVGPWYLLTFKLVAAGFRYTWGLEYVATAIVANSRFLWDSLGPAILGASALGFFDTMARSWRGQDVSVLTVACALGVADWTFQCVVPAAIQDRYLAPLLPPLLLLAGNGIVAVARWSSQHLAVRVKAMLALLLVLGVVPAAMAVPPKASLGFVTMAPQLFRSLPDNNRTVLIVTNGRGEAAGLAALAMYDPNRPSIFAVRGSRLLGGGGYNNSEYRPRFQTIPEVMAAIDAYSIPLVLYHPNFPDSAAWAHVNQVEDASHLYAARWQQVEETPSLGAPIILFRLPENAAKPQPVGHLLALSAPKRLPAEVSANVETP